MRVLVLSSVFPNSKQPTLGVFVRERVRRVARRCHLVVVAPAPWFPLNRLIRGTQWSGIPTEESDDGLRVLHPRFFCVPRYLKCLDGFIYACSLIPFLVRLRRDFPFDLIDAHFAYPDGMAAALLGKVFACPVVITLRGSIVRLSEYRLHRPQLRWALDAATRVLSVSESLKQVAVSLGVAAGKIGVIPNGVDSNKFFPMDHREARQSLGLPLDRTILLSVGGVYEGKGHHFMLEALSGLTHQVPRPLYIVVGAERRGDPYRRTLERIIESRGLTEYIHFAGSRPHDELRRWYAAADLFCLATRSEGWANVLLEALACGVPVVTTCVGGNPEIICHERYGYLVPFGNIAALRGALVKALATSWDREGMVRYARSYTWERAAESVVDEFRRLVVPDLAPAPAAAVKGPIREDQ